MDKTLLDIAQDSARRWDLPIIEDPTRPHGQLMLVYRDTKHSDRAPGVYVQPNAGAILVRDLTAEAFPIYAPRR